MHYEYRVVPAPSRGEKAKGARGVADRFSLALMHVMNELGAEGWEYLRAETLPCDERKGLFAHRSIMQNVLVFRREITAETPEIPDNNEPVIPSWARIDEAPADTVAEPAAAPGDATEEAAENPAAEPAGEPAFTRPRLGAARRGTDGPFPMVGPARKGRDSSK